jgi:hypothetical protein
MPNPELSPDNLIDGYSVNDSETSRKVSSTARFFAKLGASESDTGARPLPHQDDRAPMPHFRAPAAGPWISSRARPGGLPPTT